MQLAGVPMLSTEASKMQIVLEAMWNSRVTVQVAADEALNEGCSPQHVCHWADVGAGQTQVAGRVA